MLKDFTPVYQMERSEPLFRINRAKITATFEIPDATIRLEKNRDVGTMSGDDLEWCFGGSFKFIDSLTKQTLLFLAEASLLGLAADLSIAMNDLCEGRNSEVPDREGTFYLLFTLKEGQVHVRDEFSGQEFYADIEHLIHAVHEFVELLFDSLGQLFPEIIDNPSFVTLFEKIGRRFEWCQGHR